MDSNNILNINNNIWNISRVLEELFGEIMCECIVDKLCSDDNWFYNIESIYNITPSNLYMYYDIKRFYIKSIRSKIYGVDYNILKHYNKDYNLDMTYSELYGFFKNLKEIASNTTIDYHLDDICEYFEENTIEHINISNIPTDIETKIINQYAYDYICNNFKENPTIFKLYKNIFIYNSHKKKHNRFISLYKKLQDFTIKNKQKQIIHRIFNNIFNYDILDTILYNY